MAKLLALDITLDPNTPEEIINDHHVCSVHFRGHSSENIFPNIYAIKKILFVICTLCDYINHNM